MDFLFVLPIFLPLLTSLFLFINKKIFNELVTNFFTLNGSLLSFAISLFACVAFALDKFKPISVTLYQWTKTPDITIAFTLDGLSLIHI